MKTPAQAALLCTVLALAASTVRAEVAPDRRLGVTANLLGVATLNPTLDIELALSRRWTVGATAWWEVRAVRPVEDRWGQLRVGFYPGGHALAGASIALTGGIHRAYREDDAAPDVRARATAATAGLLVGYTWRFWDRMLLTPVLGAKATLSDHDEQSPLEPAYLEGRLDMGMVF